MKIGLDDYLCKYTIDDFRSLPKREIRKQTVEEMIAEASLEMLPEIIKRLAGGKEIEKAICINALSKKLNIPKRAIAKDVKAAGPSQGTEDKISTTAYFPELVDLAIDKDGTLLFLINKDGHVEGVTVYEIGGSLYKPPEVGKIPFSVPRAEEVIRWMKADTAEVLFHDLLSHLKKFSYLPDHQFIIVACYTFLTYIQDHPDIHYFPMLLFWSAPERGKSRTGKAIASCSYRGIHVVDLREANLFRYSQDFRATLFIDVMDLWKKTEKNGSEDILLLRYERGAKIARVLYPEKGAFNDMVFFDVYGPTVMASNEPIHHILDTRCIPIAMQNKPGSYENPKPEKALEIRERLTAWRARVMNKPLPHVEPIPGIAGRLWDISEPLFQVCKMVSPSHMDTLEKAILEVAGQRLEDKQDTLDGQIVSILKSLSPDGIPEWAIQIQAVVDNLNKKRPEGHELTPRYVGQRIKGLSIPKRKTHGVYEAQLTRTILNTLLIQYGLENNSSEGIPRNTSPTSPNIQDSTNSDTYRVDIAGDIGGHCLERPPERPPEQSELFQAVRTSGDIGDIQRGVGMRENKPNLREGII